jgi:hypothetical protein
VTDEPARLTEAELLVRMRACQWPGPVVHVGPAYPIASFAAFDNPYPGYYYGARVVVDAGLMDQVAVEETPLTV